MRTENNETCTPAVLARLLGLSARRISQLAVDGIIPKAVNGRYAFIEANHRYIEYVKGRSAATLTAQKKAELLEIERETKAFKLDKEKGLYILRSEVGGELVKRIMVLKRDFKVLEHKLTKYPKAREIVKDHIHRMMVVYSGKIGPFKDSSNRTKELSPQSSTAGSMNSAAGSNTGLVAGLPSSGRKRKIQDGK